MKLTEKPIRIDSEHSIEFGEAPWDSSVEVVRRRKNNSSGGYDPHSSSTIPIDEGFLDISDLINACLSLDKIPDNNMKQIHAALQASAARKGITL